MAELITTNTNSATDSKGWAFGLEGDLFVYVIGAVIGSIIFLTLLLSILQVAPVVAVPLGVAPTPLMLVYLKLFKVGKPPHYQEDLFEYLINGPGVEKSLSFQKENPHGCG